MDTYKPLPFYRRYAPLIFITLVLLFGAFLRIYHITQQSIWFDEAFAWNIVRQPDMYPRIAADTHPPLYYLFLRVWIFLVGDSPLALRMLSMLFGMMTVALVYQIAREVVRQRGGTSVIGVPIFAALVMAMTDAEIDLAQEARNYTLYTMLACWSMWLYLRWMRVAKFDIPAWRQPTFILWIVANIALVYTHYQGAFIPAIQGLHALLFLRQRQRLIAIGGLVVSGLAFLPWFIGVTVPQAQNAIENDIPFSIPSDWETFIRLLNEFLTQQWALVIALMLLGLVNIRYLSPASDADSDGMNIDVKLNPLSPTVLILAWLVIPFVLLFFGNFYAALLTERKLAMITPAIALLVGFGLGNVRQPASTLIMLALVVYGVYTVDSYRLKEPWDEIALDAVQYAGENDLALIEVGNGQYPMVYYWEEMMPEGVLVSTFPVLGDPTTAPTTDFFTYYDGLMPDLFAYNRDNQIGTVATAWLAHWYSTEPSIERLESAGYVRTMTTIHQHLDNDIMLYRYDLLPDAPEMTFANGMILNAVEIDGDDLRIDLWWSSDTRLDTEYVTSALLFDANGQLVAQLDSPPFYGERSTLAWEDDAVVYDPKWLALTEERTDLPDGTYTVEVQVYRFVDGGIENIPTQDGDLRLNVGTIER